MSSSKYGGTYCFQYVVRETSQRGARVSLPPNVTVIARRRFRPPDIHVGDFTTLLIQWDGGSLCELSPTNQSRFGNANVTNAFQRPRGGLESILTITV
jgi:hypothetical protein